MLVDQHSRSAATSLRLFYWCHTTSRQPFETGIQRVTRRLGFALSRLGFDIVPVGRHEGSGLIEVIGKDTDAFDTAMSGWDDQPTLFIPELTADLVERGADPACMAKAYGMRSVTLVHDLIPLKLREYYPVTTWKMFIAYYESLSRSDAVLATTMGVADELRHYLGNRALCVPPIFVVPLPAQFGDYARVTEPAPARNDDENLKLTAVVTWERRKNLLRLVRAVERARREAMIELTLVGRQGVDPVYDAEVEALLATTSGITVAGPLTDQALAKLIAESHATVYPSWEEGFGLPIGESLWLGRPCVSHNGSSMAEIGPGGGTLMIDMTDEDVITSALISLAAAPQLLIRLSEEARIRPLTSWDDYAVAIANVLATRAIASRGG